MDDGYGCGGFPTVYCIDAGLAFAQRCRFSRVRPKKKPRADADGETPGRSPTVDPVSKVLGDDNLLGEILLRTGFPTTLVRAALVCRCWYQLALDRGFLRRFRELHPPRLLGFYIDTGLVWPESMAIPRFVPMLPQPPELAAVVRRMASHNFGTCEVPWIMDSRNGSISPDIVKEEY